MPGVFIVVILNTYNNHDNINRRYFTNHTNDTALDYE